MSARPIAVLVVVAVVAIGALVGTFLFVGRRDARPMTLERALFPDPEIAELRSDRYGEHVALLSDGHVYGSNGDDLPTMVAAAALPLFVHPSEAPSCAVIGAGSLVEVSVLAGLGCSEVDLFERDRRIIDAAAALGEWVDPRVLAMPPAAPFRIVETVPSRRYDVVVQAVGTTAYVRPPRLFSTERFAALRALLAPGGIFVQHVQLYEMHADVHRSLMQTLALGFPYALVVAPGPESSDTFVLLSDAPITLDLARVERLAASPAGRRLVDAMDVRSPWDLVARVLFRNREEILAYAGSAPVYTSESPLSAARMPARPALPPPGDPAALDAWDDENRHFVEQFDDAFLRTFYESSWPFGRACDELPDACALARSTPSGPRSEALVALAGHGRLTWAEDGIARAGDTDVAPAPAVLASLRLHTRSASIASILSELPAELRPAASAAERGDVAGDVAFFLARPRGPEQIAVRDRMAEALTHLVRGPAWMGWDELDLEGDAAERACDEVGGCWYVAGWAAAQADLLLEAARAFARYHGRAGASDQTVVAEIARRLVAAGGRDVAEIEENAFNRVAAEARVDRGGERMGEAEMDRLDALVHELVAAEILAHERDAATWVEPTDCDRLEQAFEALGRAGITTRWSTRTSDTGCLGPMFVERSGGARGVVCFDENATEAAILGDGLELRYDVFEGGRAGAERLAREILAALLDAGLSAELADESIRITPMVWRHRATEAR